MDLITNLNWRYATKKMNGTPVEQEKVDYIIEAARLAPTSSGLHPFRIIEITDPALKEQILPIAYNQSQIVDSSHILVFAAYDRYTADRINQTFAEQAKERGLAPDFANDYKNNLISMYEKIGIEAQFNHAAKQAYIGFGMAIAAAAELKVDATPMEGFDSPALDELLNLSAHNLKSVTILALGYRDEENDWLVNLKKVRISKEEFVIKK